MFERWCFFDVLPPCWFLVIFFGQLFKVTKGGRIAWGACGHWRWARSPEGEVVLAFFGFACSAWAYLKSLLCLSFLCLVKIHCVRSMCCLKSTKAQNRISEGTTSYGWRVATMSLDLNLCHLSKTCVHMVQHQRFSQLTKEKCAILGGWLWVQGMRQGNLSLHLTLAWSCIMIFEAFDIQFEICVIDRWSMRALQLQCLRLRPLKPLTPRPGSL